MADKANLEEEGACPRTREHTDWLCDHYSKTELWKRFGIISEVVVRLTQILLSQNP